LLLASLLFLAGISAPIGDIGDILRRPAALCVGLFANLLVPLVFLAFLSVILKCWHSSDEAQNLLVGFAVVAAMPIAGSSTSWAHAANGCVALSLGLVILSTLMSPLTTPLVLKTVMGLAANGYADVLRQMSGRQTGHVLTACVVFPSIAGILTGLAIG